jgi:hypothetical protein
MRRNPPQPDPMNRRPDIYTTLREVAQVMIANNRGIPLLLACDHCGNVQYFRLDHTSDGHGEHWLP